MVEQADVDALLNQARQAQENGDFLRARQLYTELRARYPDAEQARLAEAALGQFAAQLRKDSLSEGPLSTLFMIIAGLAFWVLFGLGVAAFFSDGAEKILKEYWWWLGLGIIGSVIAGVIVRAIEKRLAQQPEGTRRIAAAFGVVPLLLLALTAVVFFTASQQAFMLEMVMIVVVSIIPAAAYYLFLVTRRPSIFNEFISNLSRLGLLDRRPIRRYGRENIKDWNERKRGPVDAESEDERTARLESYFQRFEAGYGRLRFSSDSSQESARSDFITLLTANVDSDSDYPIGVHMPRATIHIGDMLRANLVIPLGLSTVLIVAGWVLVMQPEWTSPAAEPVPVIQLDAGTNGDSAQPIVQITPVWTPVNFAFLGAYFFGLQMLFRRFVRRDLGSNAYLAFAHRIVLAIIGVWVAIAAYEAFIASINATDEKSLAAFLLAPVNENENWPAVLLIIAFVIGVFPRMLWQVIETVLAKITFLHLVVPSIESKQPLSDLDGLTVWHQARLEEEDVENVPNMATVDLVDIMLHTQIPAERLVSWVDQAILYTALGPSSNDESNSSLRNKLRSLGLRSASQVVAVYDDGANDSKELISLRATVDGNEKEGRLDVLVHALQVDANFDLVRAWRRV